MAVISFSPPETVFEKLFVTGEADIVAELHTRNKSEAPEASVLNKIEQQIEAKTGHTPVGITFDNQLNITIDRQKLLLYNVDYNEVYRLLKTAFKENEVATLRSYQQYLPIALAGEEQTVNEVLQKTLVNTVPDTEGNVRYIPLQSLVRVTPGEDLKTITAGKNGEYIPFSFYDIDNAEQLMENVKKETIQTGIRFFRKFLFQPADAERAGRDFVHFDPTDVFHPGSPVRKFPAAAHRAA